MKTIKFCVFLSLFLGGTTAFAVGDVAITGELDVALSLKHLPTRDQGKTAFSIPRLNLDIEAPIRENNQIFLQLESSEYRDGTSQRFDTQLKKAYLSLVSIFPEGTELRYGLIPDYYTELQKEQWDYDFWGASSLLPLIKYKYVSWSDLGLMYQSELPGDWGQWALTVTNGEGYQSDEIGPRKEAQLLIGLKKLAPFYATLAYTYGAYDAYDPSFNKKTRLVLNLSYEFSKGLMALEFYNAEDPANAVMTGGMAAGVDVSAYGGTSIQGQGASLFGQAELSEKADLFLRADYLSPVTKDKEKKLTAISTGFSYDTNEDLRWALAYEYTDYSDTYAGAIRDESQLILATRVTF
ncbi:hypothetical protein [Bdellovibrio sp. HCB337]|uniref:hypothetical protein n=1 Tax=Bdellovibrio sp. HCB337 TaxID=3394358 RepID=UPI0039A5C130